jgi:hypothetical protein
MINIADIAGEGWSHDWNQVSVWLDEGAAISWHFEDPGCDRWLDHNPIRATFCWRTIGANREEGCVHREWQLSGADPPSTEELDVFRDEVGREYDPETASDLWEVCVMRVYRWRDQVVEQWPALRLEQLL